MNIRSKKGAAGSAALALIMTLCVLTAPLSAQRPASSGASLAEEIAAFAADPFFAEAAAMLEPEVAGPNAKNHNRTVVRVIESVTQGPLWPPSEAMDANGDFVVSGLLLQEIEPGINDLVPTRGAIVSKNTVPPLDANGREDFSNALGAPYQVIRELDLSPGSPDLDIELFTNSFGPPHGDFGGEARVPAAGGSLYNLNQLGTVCKDIFPTSSQDAVYMRPSFPLVAHPIASFRGDNVQYDVEDGSPFDPQLGSGSECFPDGCSGEDMTSFRPTEPITLGRWLEARALLQIKLESFDAEQGAFTHARFTFMARNLIPNALYTFWAVRLDNLLFSVLPDPLVLPNVRVADDKGRIKVSYLVENPFPDPQGPNALKRLIVTSMVYHPDYQNWGACFGRLGPGVDVVAHLSTASQGDIELAEGFVTVAPRE